MSTSIKHVTAHLQAEIKRLKTARNAALELAGVPPWLLIGADETLGAASPGLAFVAVALASPLGVAPLHLPAVGRLARECTEHQGQYNPEVRRVVLLVDVCVRTLVPAILPKLSHEIAASILRGIDPIVTLANFNAAHDAVEKVSALLGDAKGFEKQATNLQRAVWVQAVGHGLVGVRHLEALVLADYKPEALSAAMGALYQHFPLVLHGARTAVEGEALGRMDREVVAFFESAVRADQGIFAEELPTPKG